MALLIRSVLGEFNADRPGFASSDPEMSDLCSAYQADGCAYWVLLDDAEKVIGGVGIAPLAPTVSGVCELRKMYLHPDFRGRFLGALLLQTALEFAGQHYRWCYLETLQRMSRAVSLYRKFGFMALPTPLADTGHHGCDKWLLLEFSANPTESAPFRK